jgi:YfiH family protein
VIECHEGACEFLRFARLSQEAPLVHAVFTRRGGVSAPPFDTLNGGSSVGDDPEAVRRNQARMVEVMGLPLVAVRPVHGGMVVEVRPEDGRVVSDSAAFAEWRLCLRTVEADAMLSDTPGFGLLWSFADCVPVLLYDPRHHAIALAHAGWRGTAQAVAMRTVRTMCERFGSRPDDLLAGLGPAVGSCCYRISEEVRTHFLADREALATASFVERGDERPGNAGPGLYLDLWESNRQQLLAAGLAPDRIELAGICTGCRTDLFYSHRMEHGRTGRFGVAIGLAG